MSFQLRCPNCGLRTSQEFRFGGEYHARPAMTAGEEEWARHLYDRKNLAGPQKEWWFHRYGCRKWFLVLRDTRDNTVIESFWPGSESPTE